MDAETGRADFYFAKLCGLGVFQPFYIAGREAHDQFGTELNHDPPGLAIVMRGNYSWNTSLQVLSTLVCQFEVVDRKSTRLNSSHLGTSYGVFCLKKSNAALH